MIFRLEDFVKNQGEKMSGTESSPAEQHSSSSKRMKMTTIAPASASTPVQEEKKTPSEPSQNCRKRAQNCRKCAQNRGFGVKLPVAVQLEIGSYFTFGQLTSIIRQSTIMVRDENGKVTHDAMRLLFPDLVFDNYCALDLVDSAVSLTHGDSERGDDEENIEGREEIFEQMKKMLLAGRGARSLTKVLDILDDESPGEDPRDVNRHFIMASHEVRDFVLFVAKDSILRKFIAADQRKLIVKELIESDKDKFSDDPYIKKLKEEIDFAVDPEEVAVNKEVDAANLLYEEEFQKMTGSVDPNDLNGPEAEAETIRHTMEYLLEVKNRQTEIKRQVKNRKWNRKREIERINAGLVLLHWIDAFTNAGIFDDEDDRKSSIGDSILSIFQLIRYSTKDSSGRADEKFLTAFRSLLDTLLGHCPSFFNGDENHKKVIILLSQNGCFHYEAEPQKNQFYQFVTQNLPLTMERKNFLSQVVGISRQLTKFYGVNQVRWFRIPCETGKRKTLEIGRLLVEYFELTGSRHPANKLYSSSN